jgi:hypothetical protein
MNRCSPGFPKGLPRYEDVLREVRLLDDSVRPQQAHQLLLLEEPPAVLHEQQERVQSLRLDDDGLAVPRQEPPLRIEAKSVELVEPDRVGGVLRVTEKP